MMLYWFVWAFSYHHHGIGQSWSYNENPSGYFCWSGACMSNGEVSGMGRDDHELSSINYLEG